MDAQLTFLVVKVMEPPDYFHIRVNYASITMVIVLYYTWVADRGSGVFDQHCSTFVDLGPINVLVHNDDDQHLIDYQNVDWMASMLRPLMWLQMRVVIFQNDMVTMVASDFDAAHNVNNRDLF